MNPPGPLRRFETDTRGVTIIEFSMIAPVMLLLICGTIDLGYTYLAQTSLTGAVARAARTSAVTQESTQTARDAAMRASIANSMSNFIATPSGTVTIVSRVYNDFNSAKPEAYQDANGNGRYDPPSALYVGDPFTDRNGNGVRDLETPIAGTTGDVGDVVRYTATFPVAHLFGFLNDVAWTGTGVNLTATAVVRNEPVKTE